MEVKSFEEVQQILAAGADITMLDNFNLAMMHTTVQTCCGTAKPEPSGDMIDATSRPIAETEVYYISIGAITKHYREVDLSVRVN